MGVSFGSCICCEACSDSCPENAIITAYAGSGDYMSHQGIIVDIERCSCCGECITCCPVGLSMEHFLSTPCDGNMGNGIGGSAGGGIDYGNEEWGNGGYGKPDDPNSHPRDRIKKLIPNWKKKIKETGINADSIPIDYAEDCSVLARVRNGVRIDICNRILNYELKDQVSIVWHEVFHVNNDMPWNNAIHSFSNPVFIDNVPFDIKNYINDVICGDLKDLPYAQNSAYNVEISFYGILSPQYYMNEIAAYSAEIALMTDVTPKYDAERKYMLWKHSEALKISQKYYNK